MTIELTKTINKTVKVDIDLPYYYKHDLMSDYGDSVIYGKIEENLGTTIHEQIFGDTTSYEIEKYRYTSIANSGLSEYFDPMHKSSKKEYESAKDRCMCFLEDYTNIFQGQ